MLCTNSPSLPLRRGRLLLLAVVTAHALSLAPVLAAASNGCSSINGGELDVELAPDVPVIKTLELQAGETVGIYNRGRVDLTLSIAGPAASASVRTVHVAAGAPVTSFAPVQSGMFTFRLTADRGSGAAGATCVAALADTPAQAADATFLTRRADRLMAEEPDRARLLRREPGLLTPDAKIPGVVKLDEMSNKARQLAFSVSLAEIAAAANATKPVSSNILDFWFEGRYGNFDATMPDGIENDSSLGVVYFGSQFKLGPEVMLGTIAQLDRADETDPHAQFRAKGSGWMVGPYASLQLSPGVFFDARAAWGLADNEVAAASGSEAFTTERQLLRSRLTGTRELGAWRFAPSVGLSYLEEASRDAATADRRVGQGRVEVLPQLSYRTHFDRDTFIEPRATVGVFWNFDALDKLAAPGADGGPDDTRLKAEAGVAIGTKHGTTINATGGMEEGDQGAPDVWSGRFQLNVPLK
jgi:hypothetical protein